MTLAALITAVVALALALPSACSDTGAGSVPLGAFHTDDECLAGRDGGGAASADSSERQQQCALNALQFRARQRVIAMGEGFVTGASDNASTNARANASAATGASDAGSANAGGNAGTDNTSASADGGVGSIASANASDSAGASGSRGAMTSVEVATYMQLKNAVEGGGRGLNITVTPGSVIHFKGTININSGTVFSITSEGATFHGTNRYGRVKLFYVRGTLKLAGLLLTHGGVDYSGAVYFDYNSTGIISNCSLTHNHASYMGGAIVAKGATLIFNNVSFSKNTATNVCRSIKHCNRRRRAGRVGRAAYILSHTRADILLQPQPESQDFYFDKDFDGGVAFYCSKPHLTGHHHDSAGKVFDLSGKCELPAADQAQLP